MKIKSVTEKNGCSMASGVAMGVLISVFISLLLAMAVAALITNEHLNEGGMRYFAYIITLISGVIGGIAAGKKVRSKYALVTGLTGLVYCLLLIGAGILFFNGGFKMLWPSVAAIAAGVAVSCVVCIAGSGGKGRRKRLTR